MSRPAQEGHPDHFEPGALSPAQASRLAERSVLRVSDFSQVHLPELPSIPGMITESERRYLYWLASQTYAGAAPIVEVGTWLGCSTIHLAAGLRDAGFPDSLRCFDKFEWGRRYARNGAIPLRKGGDFQPYFESNVRPLYPNLRVTKAALKDLTWTSGPIEILFLDAPKKLEDLSAALAAFGPSLVPGLSLIALQDYLHAPSYVLAAVLSRLSEEMEVVHVVLGGTTVAFRVKKPLSYSLAQPLDWNVRRWSRTEIFETWERIIQPLPASLREVFQPALAMMLYDQGAVDDALAVTSAMASSPRALEFWTPHAAAPHIYDRYSPLFNAIGIHQSKHGWDRVWSTKRKVRKALKLGLGSAARRLFGPRSEP